MKDKSFLGTGWSFPPTFKKGANNIDLVSAEEDIRQSMEILFSTKIGERFMQPEFGTVISDLLFEPSGVTFETYISEQIKVAILEYEPRVIPETVIVNQDQRDEGVVLIKVIYQIPQINSRSNIVYPFYINEGTSI